MESVPKLTMAHIASEIIIIGGMSYIFHKKIATLNDKITELEKKIELLEKEGGNGGSSEHLLQSQQFQQQTTQHINSIYTAIRQLATTVSTISSEQPPSQPIVQQPRRPMEVKQPPHVRSPHVRSPHVRSPRSIMKHTSEYRPPMEQHRSPVDNVPHVSFSLIHQQYRNHQDSQPSVEVIDEKDERLRDEKEESNQVCDERLRDEEELDRELKDEIAELESSGNEQTTSITDLIESSNEVITSSPPTLESTTPVSLEFVAPPKKAIKKKSKV